jgi:hypothetical protein
MTGAGAVYIVVSGPPRSCGQPLVGGLRAHISHRDSRLVGGFYGSARRADSSAGGTVVITARSCATRTSTSRNSLNWPPRSPALAVQRKRA